MSSSSYTLYDGRQMRHYEAEVDAEGWITRSEYWAWDCTECGAEVSRCRGHGNVNCPRCDQPYNAGGQRLRRNWRDNVSSWDENVGDLEGYELAAAGRGDW